MVMHEVVQHCLCATLPASQLRFLGVGEKIDALEPFHPDRVVSRLLGMGDVLSLVEEISRKVDHKKQKNLPRKWPKVSLI